jgi:hypothetical protein
MQVASNTLVTNFNTDFLDGFHANHFAVAGHSHQNMLSGSGQVTQLAFWSSDSVLAGDNALYWDYTSKRLGIGTSTPKAQLHLYSNTDQVGILLGETHTGTNNQASLQSLWGITNSSGILNFNYFSENQSVQIMRITGGYSSGTVDVNGNLKTKRFTMTQGAAQNFILTSTNTGIAVWKDPALATGWTLSGNNVYKAVGNVGIGTQQMQARCHVQTSDIPGIMVNVTQNGWGYGVLAKVESPNIAAFAVEQSGQPTLMIWGDGRINASMIRVKVPVFPDFVFDKKYSLTTIPELQDFVIQNGHLPGIPVASEVVNEGLDLGDMNVRLVQKVEELTLYIIQLYNENQELRARMDAAAIP